MVFINERLTSHSIVLILVVAYDIKITFSVLHFYIKMGINTPKLSTIKFMVTLKLDIVIFMFLLFNVLCQILCLVGMIPKSIECSGIAIDF